MSATNPRDQRVLHYFDERTIGRCVRGNHCGVEANDQTGPGNAAADARGFATNHGRFGGDWYKVQPVAKWLGGNFRKDDVLAISLGDVAGHGLQAAIIMSRVVQTLQAAILAEHEPPSAILSKANQMLNVKPDNPMVTALFGYLNVRAGTFEYATAGQMPPLWVSREGHAEYLPTNGIPLCCESQLITSDQFTSMPPGSSILLFSDGLVECADRNIERALEELRLIAADELPKFNPHPARAIVRRMWRGQEQLDDIAVLTFTMKNKVDVTPRSHKDSETKVVPHGDT